jgi:hypothetical protein
VTYVLAIIKYDSTSVTGANADQYLQYAQTFVKHLHGMQIMSCLWCIPFSMHLVERQLLIKQ